MSGTNIFDHISDEAKYVKIDPTNTPFPNTTTNLQQALDLIHPSALYPIAPPSYATELEAGVIRYATSVEVLAKGDILGVTPKGLNDYKTGLSPATTLENGWVKLVTAAEFAGSDDTRAFTSLKLKNYLDTVRVSSTTVNGLALLSTTAQAKAATDNTTWMTPFSVKIALTEFVAKRVDATTEVAGGIKLASRGDVEANSRSALITPMNLNYKFASTSHRGAFYASTSLPSSNLNDYVFTPGNIDMMQATSTAMGFVKLIDNITTNDPLSALTAAKGKFLNDDKIGKTGGTITGTLKLDDLYSSFYTYTQVYSFGSWYYKTTETSYKSIDGGKVSAKAALNVRPVNSLYLTIGNEDPNVVFGGTWTKIQGRSIVGAGTATDSRGETKTFRGGISDGSYNCALTKDNLPTHQHAGWGEYHETRTNACLEWYEYWNGSTMTRTCKKYGTGPYWEFGIAKQYGRNNVGTKGGTDTDNYYYWNSPVGGSQPHNNMQPYITINIWRRTK